MQTPPPLCISDDHSMPASIPLWEINCGGPGNVVVLFGHTVSEVMDQCGHLLYANLEWLIDLHHLEIRLMEPGEIKNLGDGYEPIEGVNPVWLLRALSRDGTVSVRQLESKSELFGMLLADLKRGAIHIHVTNLRAV